MLRSVRRLPTYVESTAAISGRRVCTPARISRRLMESMPRSASRSMSRSSILDRVAGQLRHNLQQRVFSSSRAAAGANSSTTGGNTAGTGEAIWSRWASSCGAGGGGIRHGRRCGHLGCDGSQDGDRGHRRRSGFGCGAASGALTAIVGDATGAPRLLSTSRWRSMTIWNVLCATSCPSRNRRWPRQSVAGGLASPADLPVRPAGRRPAGSARRAAARGSAHRVRGAGTEGAAVRAVCRSREPSVRAQ